MNGLARRLRYDGIAGEIQVDLVLSEVNSAEPHGTAKQCGGGATSASSPSSSKTVKQSNSQCESILSVLAPPERPLSSPAQRAACSGAVVRVGTAGIWSNWNCGAGYAVFIGTTNHDSIRLQVGGGKIAGLYASLVAVRSCSTRPSHSSGGIAAVDGRLK